MGTLLEAIGIVLETHFGFGFPNGSPIGDSLREGILGDPSTDDGGGPRFSW